jgi:hypothetical protein
MQFSYNTKLYNIMFPVHPSVRYSGPTRFSGEKKIESVGIHFLYIRFLEIDL